MFDFVVDCPLCKKRHSFRLSPDWLRAKLESGDPLEIHCIEADLTWTLSKHGRETVLQQLVRPE